MIITISGSARAHARRESGRKIRIQPSSDSSLMAAGTRPRRGSRGCTLGRVRSVRGEGWLATIGGALANVLPVIGWLSIYLGVVVGSATGTGTSGAANGLAFGVLVSLALGGLGVIGWLCGAVGAIVGLVRQRAGSPGRGLVFAGLALSVVAVLGWVIEWVILFAAIDEHKGAFRL
jgi:hypothetical protein